MAIVKLPCFGILDERGGPTETTTIAEYQNKVFVLQRFVELSRFVLEKTFIDGSLGFDVNFRSSIFAGRGLAFIYRDPLVNAKALEYKHQRRTGQEPETRTLQPGYALTLDEVSVHINDEIDLPVEVSGQLDGGLVTVAFNDFDNLGHYVELNRDPTNQAAALAERV